MYPENTTMIYSNFTPRKSRIKGIDRVVFFGLQHFIIKYLLGKFKKEFFDRPWHEVKEEYEFAIKTDMQHIKDLHDLGYLPIKIKAVKEGMQVNIGVPCFTIRNTHKNFAWLTNYLETLISTQLWQPITSATLAFHFRKMLDKYALETTGSTAFVPWQGHDFSMRGMSSVESAILSGMGHLLSFSGTDTIPAIYALRNTYGAKVPAGASVPATEHSVMCMGTKEDEIETFRRLLKLYPTGVLSIVSDTWSLPKVLTKLAPALKKEIMERDGKVVFRPDSFWTNPEDCICGFDGWHDRMKDLDDEEKECVRVGVVRTLYKTFGGTTNDKGYIELDSHVGAIYGDSINYERGEEICKRNMNNGFASTNVVFGVGSFTYQYNTRDTFGFAMKATYGELEVPMPFGQQTFGSGATMIEGREIFKDPITDDGTKKSAKGLLRVDKSRSLVFDSYKSKYKGDYNLILVDQIGWEQEEGGVLETVFEDGRLLRVQTLDNIRTTLGTAA